MVVQHDGYSLAVGQIEQRGCAPAQTTPRRMEFQPLALIWATSASLNVVHELQLPAAWHWSLTTSSQTLEPETDGKYGGPFTTTFGPAKTTLAFVCASTNRCPSTRTARGAEAAAAMTLGPAMLADATITVARVHVVTRIDDHAVERRPPGCRSALVAQSQTLLAS
jgi:hypothetical protein